MTKIRSTEEGIVARYNEGKMRCPTHLSIGQEAVPAALGLLLQKTDLAVSTHRSHAHYLGKGGCLKKMVAEIYGKATGCSRGKGGSMHLIDREHGFMGSTAIVGNSIPIGVGLALSFQLKKSDQIAVVFLGDGAVEEGAFYESVNFAAVRGLPVLFVCENNLYSVYSSLRPRQPQGRAIFEMVKSLGVESELGDGNDVIDCLEKFSRIINEIRATSKPRFIELPTYRWREHCGVHFDNQLGYRSEAEFLEWRLRDPVVMFKDFLLRSGEISKHELEEVETRVLEEVNEAFDFAEQSDWPEQMEAFDALYSSSLTRSIP